MKSIKNLLLFFFYATCIQQSYCQVYKFKTTGFSVLERNDKGNWGKWSDLQDASIVITLDTTKNRIVIYSQEIQLYEIMNYEKVQENENDEIYSFQCRNDDGEPFVISIIKRKNQENRKQLYINQKNVIVVYNIVNLIGNNER
ncbi:hypothetical protein [Flavobacterium luteum]|uniref:Uncharacterized protein n=1 Tax=Flavobacterium luteum TaxID=2026654 RepID=A0A7J5AEX9_9FLAO|nr:hypothetical protein [Flavobacterium luteum]KAB1155539.1 hypothetical protein F6464_10515 [Flavobacterium luteum]